MSSTRIERPYWIHRNPNGSYAVKVIMGSRNVSSHECGDPITRSFDDPNSEDWYTQEDFDSKDAAQSFIDGMELASCNPVYDFVKVGEKIEFVHDRRVSPPEKHETRPVIKELPQYVRKRAQLPYGYELAETCVRACPPGQILMETYRHRSGGRPDYYKYYYVDWKDVRYTLSHFVKNKKSWLELENGARKITKYNVWVPKPGRLV